MVKSFLSTPQIQNQRPPASPGFTLKTKIIWTLIFKIVVVLSLFCVFKTYKKVVSSQDVAQKLLTTGMAADTQEL